MDRRQVKTRQAVYKAFVELLNEKSFYSITIQDILDRADIGRSTFYAHFKTKNDLLDVLCGEIFDHAFSSHTDHEETHDFSKHHDLRSELTHVLYHIKSSDGYALSIMSSDGAEVFMRYFRERLTKIFEDEVKEPPQSVPRDYYINYLVGGFIDTVRWWMTNTQAPEEVMGLYSRMYMSVL